MAVIALTSKIIVAGHADRNACNVTITECILPIWGYWVERIINRSMRDPAARKGPSYRPDYGRTYRGEPH